VILTIKAGPGSHIADVCKEALLLANSNQNDVQFDFNGVVVLVHPGDSAETVIQKYHTDCEAAHQAYISSAQYVERQKREAEEYRRKCAAVMIETAKTETEMREAPSPWPHTEKQLTEYIRSLVDRDHDYGTCCYALSLAAVAAFQYVCHKLGVTGFQSSCADLDFIRRTRSLKGPFILLKAEDLMYPQYDLFEKLQDAINEWQPWVKEQAAQKLAGHDGMLHPNVLAHWKRLAGVE
jgi:hypothetical protein